MKRSFRLIFKWKGVNYNVGRINRSIDNSLYLTLKAIPEKIELHKSAHYTKDRIISIPDNSEKIAGKFDHFTYHLSGNKHAKTIKENDITYVKLNSGKGFTNLEVPVHLWTIIPAYLTKLPVIKKTNREDKWFENIKDKLNTTVLSIFVWPKNERMVNFTFTEGIRKDDVFFTVMPFGEICLGFFFYSPANSQIFPDKSIILSLDGDYIPIIHKISSEGIKYSVNEIIN